jgi:hypothetical protein
VPLIRDNLDALSNSKYLSSLDICGGYLSMPIQEKDRDYFAFITHFGLYRWKRVPYGWRNAGSHFCYLIDTILAGLKYQILISYVDDILIYGGRSFHEHLSTATSSPSSETSPSSPTGTDTTSSSPEAF